MSGLSATHTPFLIEQVARIIHYYVEPDPRLISLSIDDAWIAFSEEEKDPWYQKAVEWLDALLSNYPTSYAQLVEGIIEPKEKFW